MTIEKFTGGKDLPPLSDQAVLNFCGSHQTSSFDTPVRCQS